MSPKKSEQVDFFATETEETEAAEAREICLFGKISETEDRNISMSSP